MISGAAKRLPDMMDIVLEQLSGTVSETELSLYSAVSTHIRETVSSMKETAESVSVRRVAI